MPRWCNQNASPLFLHFSAWISSLCWQCLCVWWFPEVLGSFHPYCQQFQTKARSHQFQKKFGDWLLLDYLGVRPWTIHWLWSDKCNAWIGRVLVTWPHPALGSKHCPIHNEWESRGRGCYLKRSGVWGQTFFTFEWGLSLTEAQPRRWNNIALRWITAFSLQCNHDANYPELSQRYGLQQECPQLRHQFRNPQACYMSHDWLRFGGF